MNTLLDMLSFFHFLRPGWLAVIPVALLLGWRVRARRASRDTPPDGIAPHLATALTVGADRRRALLPIDGVVAVIVLAALGAAGPTWSRVANPLVAQTAPLAIALKVTPSMLESDVAPTRLERAKFKILDVLAARPGGRTALIAYAGSAHRVVPLTEDPEVLKPFLEGLAPTVLPKQGQNATAALNLARAALEDDPTPGAILFVLDALDDADRAAFAEHADAGGVPIVFLHAAGAGSADSLAALKQVPNAAAVPLSADKSDVREIDRRVASAFRDSLARDENQQWEDRGWMLAWPAALLILLWFRRGWTMRWGVAFAAVLSLPAQDVHADAVDWFLTPDQQARLAYEDGRIKDAAALFQEPMWKGYALMGIGQYGEAAQVFARVASADAAFAQGIAHIRNRQYRDGVRAFETALKRDPEHAGAAHNVTIARAIVRYVERVQQESGTGEGGGEGADEVRFDKEAEGGTQTVIEGATRDKVETAEQWMRTVDTRTEDLLKIRFALEAAESKP